MSDLFDHVRHIELELDSLRKKSEILVQEHKDVLEEHRARLDLALDAAGVGMWDWTIENNTLHWDHRMCKMWGVPEFVEKTYETFIDRVIPKDRKRIQAAVEKTLKTGVPYNVHYVIKRDDGTTAKIHAKGMRYPNCDNPQKLIGVCMEEN